jgi:hypothetical protein
MSGSTKYTSVIFDPVVTSADEAQLYAKKDSDHVARLFAMDSAGNVAPVAATIAMAVVDGEGAGFLSNFGFASFTRNAVGDYSLTLAGVSPEDVNCVVQVTPRTLFGVAVTYSASVSGGVVRVQFFNVTGGAAIGAIFNVTVSNNS